jgi:hypothetical protein
MNPHDVLGRPGTPIRLGDLDLAFTYDLRDKADAHDKLETDVERLADSDGLTAVIQAC